jgi:glucan phosphoethanolaminetransferase (alkaline phosphatase superfamily)
MTGMSGVYARCEVVPMTELISTYFIPIVAIWGVFYIFVLWVLWMIVKSLKSIDRSLKEIADSTHQPKS